MGTRRRVRRKHVRARGAHPSCADAAAARARHPHESHDPRNDGVHGTLQPPRGVHDAATAARLRACAQRQRKARTRAASRAVSARRTSKGVRGDTSAREWTIARGGNAAEGRRCTSRRLAASVAHPHASSRSVSPVDRRRPSPLRDVVSVCVCVRVCVLECVWECARYELEERSIRWHPRQPQADGCSEVDGRGVGCGVAERALSCLPRNGLSHPVPMPPSKK